jgi:hypothetical protein
MPAFFAFGELVMWLEMPAGSDPVRLRKAISKPRTGMFVRLGPERRLTGNSSIPERCIAPVTGFS